MKPSKTMKGKTSKWSKTLFNLSILVLLTLTSYGQLQIGTAIVKITPPLGTPLAVWKYR